MSSSILSFGPECDVYPSGNLWISLIQMESDAKRTHCVFFKIDKKSFHNLNTVFKKFN